MGRRTVSVRPPRGRFSAFAAVLGPPLALAGSLLGPACHGKRVVEPQRGEHPLTPGEALCVDYPAPAPRAEEIPERPSDRSVWVDGEWEWQLRHWVWKPGGWTEPPYDSKYAPSHLVRLPNGALAWWPAHWHLRHEKDEPPAVPSSASAATEASGAIAASAASSVTCPTPPKPLAAGAGLATNIDLDATNESGDVFRRGAVLQYVADAPPAAPGRVIADAQIPSDTRPTVPILIGPPE